MRLIFFPFYGEIATYGINNNRVLSCITPLEDHLSKCRLSKWKSTCVLTRNKEEVLSHYVRWGRVIDHFMNRTIFTQIDRFVIYVLIYDRLPNSCFLNKYYAIFHSRLDTHAICQIEGDSESVSFLGGGGVLKIDSG